MRGTSSGTDGRLIGPCSHPCYSTNARDGVNCGGGLMAVVLLPVMVVVVVP